MKRNSSNSAAFAAAQAQYCNMMADGKGAEAALAATELSHSQGDWAWYGDPRNPKAVKPNSITLPAIPGKDEPGYESALLRRGLVVAELREGLHASYKGRELSFGAIAVVCGTPEGAVRRAFGATGIAAEGTRISKGGRYLGDEPRFYLGNRKGIGVEAAKPKSVNPASLVPTNDTVASVIPAKVEGLRKALAKGTAKKVRATKKAAPAKKTA